MQDAPFDSRKAERFAALEPDASPDFSFCSSF